ncbi:MAG: relaxase/mobilization nuclease domain-containing protein [Desulfovibrionaceae bacterium]
MLGGKLGQTRQIIDVLPHNWRYTSGGISFAREDAPAAEQQREVMRDFERAAFAGIGRCNYDILWVRHSHAQRVELHFVIPRVELSTGKAFNPAPPSRRTPDGAILPPIVFELLSEHWNWKCGWARPGDILRKRTRSPSKL